MVKFKNILLEARQRNNYFSPHIKNLLKLQNITYDGVKNYVDQKQVIKTYAHLYKKKEERAAYDFFKEVDDLFIVSYEEFKYATKKKGLFNKDITVIVRNIEHAISQSHEQPHIVGQLQTLIDLSREIVKLHTLTECVMKYYMNNYNEHRIRYNSLY